MKYSIELESKTPSLWVEAVMSDFDSFLQDHANCERKASAMAMSFVAKYPDRIEILPELIETGIEELEHFRDVYEIMKQRGVQLPSEIGQDIYVKKLVDACKSDVEGRFLDRLLVASIVECRGAERFRLVYENLPEGELKNFYHRLWASEAKHGNIFVKMALNYFDRKLVFNRLGFLNKYESEVINEMPIKAALH